MEQEQQQIQEEAARGLLRLWGQAGPPEAEMAELSIDGDDPGPLAVTPNQQLIYRYLRRRQRIEAEYERITAGTAAMLKDLERQLQGLDYLYASKVAEAVRGELKGKAKSIKTPFGVAGFRSQPARLVVEDQAKLIAAWAAFQLPQPCVKKVTREPEYKLVKAELDKLYAAGEIPPGCVEQSAREVFYVKGGE